MAVDSAKIWRQRILGAKAETSTGVAIALTGTDATLNVFDPKLDYQIKPNDRRGQSSWARIPQVPGARAGTCVFETELYGHGATGTPEVLDTLLQACGFIGTAGAYVPVTGSSSAQTNTFGHYIDGRLKKIAGAMGNATFKFKAGDPVRIAWNFLGKWAAPTDTALLTPTYSTVIPPRWAGATLTVGGVAYFVSEMEIALNNVITLREDANDVTGYHAAVIVDQDITVKMDPESTALATIDWYGAHLAGTSLALSTVLGATANNIFTITAPAMQLRNPPQDKDRNGVYADELEFQCNRASAAGDDQLSIVAS